jgi:hypothetical protein
MVNNEEYIIKNNNNDDVICTAIRAGHEGEPVEHIYKVKIDEFQKYF